jgi:phosphopantothenoylcysteine decarboxylase/phosphopantothenate--cysteine ligase
MRIVDPESGPLASGDVGPGRLASLDSIEAAIVDALGETTALVDSRREMAALSGRKVIVTAGPTVEAIDPVRFVSNRSSGKMGYAIAQAAKDAGADVTLVTGPTALTAPRGVRTIPVESAEDMKDMVLALLPETDAVIMAAAVADYRPRETSLRKIKKRDAGSELTIRMIENPDVLRAVVAARRSGTIVVGFKAETGDATDEAARMLRDKKLDLVVANDISGPGSGFGSDTDRVTFVSADGAEALPLLPKTEVARLLVAKLAARLGR